mmetsp:Transcript_5598/g.11414  ORF Transcript_5598/g.11414 Transcript_5598/m.11414 type:complete len:149 (-) Transcript_5598:76-522(-)
MAEAKGAEAKDAGEGSKAAAEDEVIDWGAAMEQCGDDEEFLRELLVDLKDELSEQNDKLVEEFGKSSPSADWPTVVKFAAHSMKGASANLMVKGLTTVCSELEKKAKASDADSDADRADAKAMAADVQRELTRFTDYLESDAFTAGAK